MGLMLALAWLVAPRMTWVHPKATVALAKFGGISVPVQTRREPTPDDRVWFLSWDGPGCGGSSQRTLDGEHESALQPQEPYMVRMGAGECQLVAGVIGTGGKLLDRIQLTFKVCGEGC